MHLNSSTTPEPVELAPDVLHVWTVTLDVGHPPWHELRAILAADERQRADRYRLDDVRRRFVVARAALRTILGRYLQTPPQKVALAYEEHGKPRLGAAGTEQRAGGSPRSSFPVPRFNLAHSGELALVAVTSGCEVGVDVERLREVRHLAEIAQRHFHADEVSAVMEAPAVERRTAFFRCWTRKEAVLKAIGAGIHYPLDAFCVPVADAAPSWIELPAWKSFEAARCWLMPIEPATGYVAAVACLNAERSVTCCTCPPTSA